MGRKCNNLPARLARKKKVKDKNNLQIQGRAGLGRRREKGRSERQKQRQKGKEVTAEPKKAQLGYVELAKQQEEKAEAAASQVEQVVQAQSKRARKKQKKRSQEESQPEATWEKSHVIPKADLNRDDTVYFGEDRKVPEADMSKERPLPKASAVTLAPGMLMRIFGLEKMPKLNGELGTLIAWDASAGRWSVLLMSGDQKLLKKENLEVKALLRPETPVRLFDLRMQELNGKTGCCKEWKSEKKRQTVQIYLKNIFVVRFFPKVATFMNVPFVFEGCRFQRMLFASKPLQPLQPRWLVAVAGHGDALLKAENLEVLLQPGLQVQLCGLQTAELNGKEVQNERLHNIDSI